MLLDPTFVAIAILGAMFVLPPVAALCVRLPWLPLLLFWALPVGKAWLVAFVPAAHVVDPTLLSGVLLIAVIGLAYLTSRAQLAEPDWRLVGLQATLAVWLIISLLWTSAPEYGAYKALRFAVFSSLLLIGPMVLLSTPKRLQVFTFGLVAVGIGVAVSLIVNPSYEIGEVASQWEIRQTVLGSNALIPAFIMAVAGGLILTGMGRVHGWLRVAAILAVPLLALAIYRTGSRSMFIQMFMALGVWVLVTRSKLRWGYRILAAVGLLAFPTAVQLLGPSAGGGRIVQMVQDPMSVLASNERVELWSAAFRGGLSSPVLGRGSGAFAKDVLGVDERQFPHNLLLEAFMENGLPGLILLTCLIAVPFASYFGFHVRARQIGAETPLSDTWFAAMAAACLNFFFHWDVADSRLTWALFGVSIAAIAVERELIRFQFQQQLPAVPSAPASDARWTPEQVLQGAR